MSALGHGIPKNVLCYLPLVGAVVASMLAIRAIRGSKIIERFDVDKRFTDAARYNGLVFISGQVGTGNTIEEQTQRY